MSSDSTEKTFRIVATAGTRGRVVELTERGLLGKDVSEEKGQQWTLQYNYNYDKSGETVAFRNLANGEYLNCAGGKAYGRIDTAVEEKWWTLQKDEETGAYWIKSNNWMNAYLYNHDGDSRIYAFPKDEAPRPLTWYLRDVNAKDDSTTAASKEISDLKAREEAVAKKEQDLASAEAAQEKQAEQLDVREKELKNMAEKQEEALKSNESASAEVKKLAERQAELEEKLADLHSKEQELASREATVGEQEKQAKDVSEKAERQNSDKEAELQRKEEELKSREAAAAEQDKGNKEALEKSKMQSSDNDVRVQRREEDFKEQEEALTKREEELRKQEEELARQQEELKKQEEEIASASQGEKPATDESEQLVAMIGDLNGQIQDLKNKLDTPASSSGDTSEAPTDSRELPRLEEENARLKDLTAQLALQLNDAQKQVQSQRLPKTEDPDFAAMKAENKRLKEEIDKLRAQVPPVASQKTDSTTNARAPSSKQAHKTSAAAGGATTPATSKGTVAPIKQPISANTSSQRRPSIATVNTSISKHTTSRALKPSAQDITNRTKQIPAPHPSPPAPPHTPASPRENNSSPRKKPTKLRAAPSKSLGEFENEDGVKIIPGSSVGAHVHGSGPKVRSVCADSIVYECGHVLHPPPRKIEKKIVGILYER